MIIKPFRGRTDDIASLEKLAALHDANSKPRTRIDRELAIIRAGDKGEREAAYEIDFHHGPSRNWAVIHDLRIEHDGRVAQMDHLVIGRFLDIWVCETKHFNEGVAINEQGEFTRFFNKRPQSIPSPIEQNRKHLRVFDSILRSDKVTLPTRLGIAIRPRLHSVILISQGARVTRPKANIDGIDTIVKSDQLRTRIEQQLDTDSAATALMTIGKMTSSATLEAFALQVARLHRPMRIDWQARFGLPAIAAGEAPSRVMVEPDDLPAKVMPAPSTVPLQVGDNLIPTSKLGAALGLPNVEATVQRLQHAGLLQPVADEWQLTERGIAAGGQFVKKSRFGPYFRWPRDLRC